LKRTNISNSRQVGQVVKVKVISVDPAKQRLRLTFNLSEEPKQPKSKDNQAKEQSQAGEGPAGSDTQLEVGDLVPQAVIKSKSEDGISVEFKHSNALCAGFVPRLHLSDLIPAAQHLSATLQVGAKIKNLRVVRRKGKEEGAAALLSLKTAIDCSKPDALEDVDIESIYQGYVSNLTEFGAFVAFGKGLTAFVPWRTSGTGSARSPPSILR
jgi:ribosomal protein S1